MAWQPVATMLDWVLAPDWVTPEEAVRLSGHDEDTIKRLILDGGVDAELGGGTWLVEKRSLYEFQEALSDVLWLTSHPPSGLQPERRRKRLGTLLTTSARR
jgi:hypothetical protein